MKLLAAKGLNEEEANEVKNISNLNGEEASMCKYVKKDSIGMLGIVVLN